MELPAQGLDFSREVWIDIQEEIVGKKRVVFLIDDAIGMVKGVKRTGLTGVGLEHGSSSPNVDSHIFSRWQIYVMF